MGTRRRDRRKRTRRARGKAGIFLTGVLLLLSLGFGMFRVFGGGVFQRVEETGTGAFRQADMQAVEEGGWCLLLVNGDHPMEGEYGGELVTLSGGESVDSRIYPHLQAMFDAMRQEGIYPVVASGYRSFQEQQEIYREKIHTYMEEGYSRRAAEREARDWVALPGTSEHETGLAVDINADGIHSYGDQVYDWLEENAWRYGFIYRYQEEKQDITGIAPEPWHYRYVGPTVAQEIWEQGLCLEEYLEA